MDAPAPDAFSDANRHKPDFRTAPPCANAKLECGGASDPDGHIALVLRDHFPAPRIIDRSGCDCDNADAFIRYTSALSTMDHGCPHGSIVRQTIASEICMAGNANIAPDCDCNLPSISRSQSGY